jgi:tetratricopeptide (TPR) repeat protein
MALACALSLVAGLGTSAFAQKKGKVELATVSGVIRDSAGNPFNGVVVDLRNTTTGQEFTASTNAAGQYSRGGVPAGNYTVNLKFKGQVVYTVILVLSAGQQATLDLNFQDLKAKQEAEGAAQAKAAAEAQAKFAAMKQHFDAGLAALEQAQQVRAEYDKLPKDKQAAMEGQLDQAANTAATELQAAVEGTTEKDPNRGVIFARLGQSYELENKCGEAADAYQKSVAVRPDAGTYNNLGNCLARTGKVDDALAAYKQAISLDPANTAMYWRNFAVGLYNSGRIKESLDPLHKATEADPKNAQAWYLLGAALVNTMEFKQEGDKLVPQMQPGTIEAYQKAIALDPNGPYGAQAKEGLQALQAMGVGGVQTQVGSDKEGKKKRR